jgi:hypothetical protein
MWCAGDLLQDPGHPVETTTEGRTGRSQNEDVVVDLLVARG